jgi:AcrR family transcriptional regulator
MPKVASNRTAKFEAKQELILNAAGRLFNARGVRATTLADVASEVGLATNSVTYYYKRKEDLASACFLRSISAMNDIFERAASEPTAERRIRRVILDYGALLEELARARNRDLVTFKEVRLMTGADRERLFEMYGEMFRAGRSLFGTDTGLNRRELNARTHLLLTAAVWTRNWIDRYDVLDYPRVSATIADILIHGFGPTGAKWDSGRDNPLNLEALHSNGDMFLQAATRLVNEQGYVGASVDKISAELKLTKGAFYHHNDNKDDLVAACFERTFAVVRQVQRAAEANGETGWDHLCAATSELIRYQLSDQGPLLRISAFSALPEGLRGETKRTIDRLAQRFGSFVVDGMVDGSIRPLDPSVAAHVVDSIINAAVELEWWVPGITTESAAGLYAKPLFIGVFTPDPCEEERPPASRVRSTAISASG